MSYAPEDYSPEELVKLFVRYGGDVLSYADVFAERCGGRREYVLARVICILSQKGNEAFLNQWLTMQEYAYQSRLMIARSEALLSLRKMPPPSEDAKMSDWKYYGEFWTELKIGLDNKAPKADTLPNVPSLTSEAWVDKMAEEMASVEASV